METPSKSSLDAGRKTKIPLSRSSTLSHEAAGAAAGFLFQLERALFWLAETDDPFAVVGVEALGDVFVSSAGSPSVHEEDKHSVQSSGHPFGDHDPRLWRTLEIWCDAALHGSDEERKARLMLVTNRPVRQEPARRIRDRNGSRSTGRTRGPLVLQLALSVQKDAADRSIARMRQMGDAIPNSLSMLYSRVMDYQEEILSSVIQRMELLDGPGIAGAELRRKVIERLHLAAYIDADHVVQTLAGWLKDVLLEAWRNQKPGWVKRRDFDAQLDCIRLALKRYRVLAQSATRLPSLNDAEKASARQKRFVEHLAQIVVDDNELDDAIEDYLRFGMERLRLLNSGEVLGKDWEDRAGQLQDRWKRIARRVCRRSGDLDPAQLGQDILEDTLSPDYLAPLAGEPQPEPYFTRGHYHRIADEDRVWWYPCNQPDY